MWRYLKPRIVIFFLAGMALIFTACPSPQPNPSPKGGDSSPATADTKQGASAPPAAASLNIVYEQQQQDHWCWSASAVMVVRTLGNSATQCNTVHLKYPLLHCCIANVPSICDKPGWPPFLKLGFDSWHTTDLALTFDQLVDEIGVYQLPVTFAWEYTDGAGG